MEPVQPIRSLGQTSKKRAVITPPILLPHRAPEDKREPTSNAPIPIPEWPTLPPIDTGNNPFAQVKQPETKASQSDELSPSRLVRSLPMPPQGIQSSADFPNYPRMVPFARRTGQYRWQQPIARYPA